MNLNLTDFSIERLADAISENSARDVIKLIVEIDCRMQDLDFTKELLAYCNNVIAIEENR